MTTKRAAVEQGNDLLAHVRFRGFIESAPDAVVIVDGAGLMLLVNAQTERMFGYERAALLGRPVDVLVPERYRDNHGEQRARYAANAQVRPMGIGLDLYGRRCDGSEFPVEISLSPLETDEGIYTACTVRDTTERKRNIEDYARRMQEASRLKSEFLANMSHELRTPLNAVIGFSALLHSGNAGPLSAVQHEYIGDILASSRHLLQLINDVLDLAKIEAGKMEFQYEAVDPSGIIREVRDILRGLAAEKRIRIHTDVDPQLERVRSDPRMLKQVLYNYVSNAIKFTDDGGEIHIRAMAAPGECFRIEVEDNGIGIAHEDMKRLFVEFQQLDAGIAKRHPGTGLGLALTRRMAEAQGGSVGATSEQGKGSTFWIVLPLRPAA